MKLKKLAVLALLTAASLILFVIELNFPTLAPVPGIKLGLANIITVYAVYSFTAGETAMVLAVRILLGALIAGEPFTLIFSFSGGLLCLAGMLLLRKVIDKKHIWVCSVLGAVLHNVGQLTAAFFVMNTSAVLAYAPFLLAAGCLAGALTGFAAQFVISRLKGRIDI
ncbi:MAG: Gx transporter family protein [Ruminococcus sp.]|nr:Gx transporter family protein [Ruminococcus sp.]